VDGSGPANKIARLAAGDSGPKLLYGTVGTVMFLLLEKFLPVLSQAFTTIKCVPDPIGRSVSIRVLFGEWNTSLLSR
jgi:hypothetical protein